MLPTFFDKELNYFVLNRIILSILCHSADIGENSRDGEIYFAKMKNFQKCEIGI